jgi:hypothetical protein
MVTILPSKYLQNLILPVLHVCETCYLALREENRKEVGVFEEGADGNFGSEWD